MSKIFSLLSIDLDIVFASAISPIFFRSAFSKIFSCSDGVTLSLYICNVTPPISPISDSIAVCSVSVLYLLIAKTFLYVLPTM